MIKKEDQNNKVYKNTVYSKCYRNLIEKSTKKKKVYTKERPENRKCFRKQTKN